MSTKTISVTIEGISALLMHRFPMETIEHIEKKPKEEQAEISAYRTIDGKLYIPGVAMQRALVSGASYSKGKGRSTLSKQAAACLIVQDEYLPIDPQEYTIDSRPVVIAATKGRIMRNRPRFDKWSVSFKIEYDPNLMTGEQVRSIVDDTGSRVGLLDFRPERKGPFGRFMVTNWINEK
jgi:hypothetical protein